MKQKSIFKLAKQTQKSNSRSLQTRSKLKKMNEKRRMCRDFQGHCDPDLERP